MCGTYFHDLSRSQVRAWIYNSEPWNKFRRVLEILRLQGLQKKFWVHFHDSCVQKRSNMLWRLHALWKFSACKVSKKKFSEHFHDLCVQKRRCLLWSSDAFCKFSAWNVYKKSSGRILKIFASKNEAVCLAVQMHNRSSPLARFTKTFWAYFHGLCVQKRRCLLWS